MALSPIFAGLTRLSYSQKLWTAASAGLAAHGCLFTHGECRDPTHTLLTAVKRARSGGLTLSRASPSAGCCRGASVALHASAGGEPEVLW